MLARVADPIKETVRKKEGPLARPFGYCVLRIDYFSFASARRAAARSVFSQEKAVALTVSPLPSR